MKPKLLQNLSVQDQAQLQAEWNHCSTLKDQIIKILDKEIEQSLIQMRDAAKGDIPNLSEYYADELSKQRTLEWVKTFFI